jgi:hypothetical protein
LTKATIHVESDQPVMVLVVPLPLRKVRSELPAARQVVETTAEPVPSNVVELRRAG